MILPHGYEEIPFPNLPPKQSWDGVVFCRAKIRDPDFHRGNKEAICMVAGFREETIVMPGFHAYAPQPWTRRYPIPGEWIEFRDFKAANAYVQVVKRVSQ